MHMVKLLYSRRLRPWVHLVHAHFGLKGPSVNVIFQDERHVSASSRPHAITTKPTHAMAKTLDNATSHTLRRGHVLGAEFVAVAQCRVIVITPFSTCVSNRHLLPPRI